MNCVVLPYLIAVFGIVWLLGWVGWRCEKDRSSSFLFGLDGMFIHTYIAVACDGEQNLFENVYTKQMLR